MPVLLCPRGKVFVHKGYTAGLCSIKGLTDAAKDGVLVLGVGAYDADIAAQVAALGGDKYLYAFGSDFGTFIIEGVCLFGDYRERKAAAGAVTEWFNKNRLSKNLNGVTVSPAGKGSGLKVFPLRLQFGNTNANTYAQSFSIVCIKGVTQ